MLQQLRRARVLLVDLLERGAERLPRLVDLVASTATGPVAEENKLAALEVASPVKNRLRVNGGAKRRPPLRLRNERIEEAANIACRGSTAKRGGSLQFLRRNR